MTLQRPFRIALLSLCLGLSGPGLLTVSNPARAEDAPARAAAQPLPPGAVAALGETVLTKADIQAATAGVPPDRLAVFHEMSNARENLASDLLLRRMIAERARKAGAERDPEIAARLKIAEEKLLAELYLDKAENAAIDDKKLEAIAREEYRAYPERFRKEELLARHILVKEQRSSGRGAMQIIAELQEKLKAGESFEDLAKQYSDDPGSAAKGGDIGPIVRGRTVPPFEEALYALKTPGSVSPPVETPFGLHLIQLIERKPPVLLPFEEVKGAIMEKLRKAQRQEMRTKLVDTLKPPGALRLDDAAIAAAAPKAPAAPVSPPAPAERK